MLNLLIKTPFKDITRIIKLLREKRGSEKETLSWIEEAINFGHGFITNLYFERILVYQHLIMAQDVKPEGERDLVKRREALGKMEAATLAAQKYVQARKLKEWESRVYRFLGRLYDYKNQFAKAIDAYKKGIPLAKYDPEFVEKSVPRQLELEAFMSFSLIMLGKFKEGMTLAKKTFDKFNSSKEGLVLKKNDYSTWAIWKSGIPIRILKAFETKKAIFDKKLVLSWLSESEKDLNPPGNQKKWVDFGFRKDELAAVKRKLTEVN